MAIVKFEQKSPKGNATIDSVRLLISPSGELFLRSGDGLVPLGEEARAALEVRFGDRLEDAQYAVKALA